jgi:hypothetical protein
MRFGWFELNSVGTKLTGAAANHARHAASCAPIHSLACTCRGFNHAECNRSFGCYSCQECCPLNARRAVPTKEPAFQPHEVTVNGKLIDLLAITEEEFREQFRGSPVKRAKWRGLMRNLRTAMVAEALRRIGENRSIIKTPKWNLCRHLDSRCCPFSAKHLLQISSCYVMCSFQVVLLGGKLDATGLPG